jgi:hypothetical protein
MMRGRPVAMLALALVVTGCGGDGSGSAGNREPNPALTLPAAGETVDFQFYTHCGVEAAQIGGVSWRVVNPLYGDEGERGSSPDGWGNPFQKGRLTVESSERAVFEARGVRVVLVPSGPDDPELMCM